ncbi:MAG TPA: Fe2+-dependent dioxygenase [Acetobacteraceae bacterium]|nr:Fe2+-dependent dioxygenase [Acetobacteraceae bacterium]
MIVHIASVLTAAQVAACTESLARADWRDGRVTAGPQSARVKANEQVAETCPVAAEQGRMIVAALESNPHFLSAALPLRIYPPLFNRYAPGMAFGDHIDNALRRVPGTPYRIRTDLSATLFLAAPEAYDGGELVVRQADAVHSIKLPAGDMVLYAADTVHHVAPVTRGVRQAAFFWVQSAVRDAGRRAILYDMDSAIRDLSASTPESDAVLRLTGCYHNLVRLWAEM